MATLWEEATKGFAAAIADIREKAVEEAYFGRVVSNGQDTPDPQAASPNASLFDQALGSITRQIDISPDKSQNAPEPGGGMDR